MGRDLRARIFLPQLSERTYVVRTYIRARELILAGGGVHYRIQLYESFLSLPFGKKLSVTG